jgi:peptide deformylase
MTSRNSVQLSSATAALKHWRDVRGYSQVRLASLIDCSPSELSRIEAGFALPSPGLAARADHTLRAGGELITAFTSRTVRHPSRTAADNLKPAGAQLLLCSDDADLDFDGATYHVRHRRRILNTGPQLIPAYAIHISIDRFPRNPDRSRRRHESHPLRAGDLNFSATAAGRRLKWELGDAAAAYQEIWLQLKDSAGRPLLPPGREITLVFSYEVDASIWGNWFQRIVRHPTLAMTATLGFPASLGIEVGGSQLLRTAAALPMLGVHRSHSGDTDVYRWAAAQPEIDSVFRFEWRTSAKPSDPDEYADPVTARQTMQAAGVVQQDDPVLRRAAPPYHLPRDAEDCSATLRVLSQTLDRLGHLHHFGKGMGLAAPQIGIPRAAVVIRDVSGHEVRLINPTVLRTSSESDTQFEGCLSFFDQRGMVERPVTAEIEHCDLAGHRLVTTFRDGLARLVQHEVDHVAGLLYTDRMSAGATLIQLSDYSQIGQPWTYRR